MTSKPSAEDEQRFDQWVREHGRAVRGFVFSLVRKDDVADDLLQEVFKRAWQARERYEEQGTARAYLLRIADRLVCDWARRQKPELQMDDDQWQMATPFVKTAEPNRRIEHTELREELEFVLDRVSPSQRRVLLLRFFGDMSFQEIAEVLDCPLNTALSHCRRGLLQMKQLMTEG
jgi:RNA polymerase sigma-70 factor (ECF subfamily)